MLQAFTVRGFPKADPCLANLSGTPGVPLGRFVAARAPQVEDRGQVRRLVRAEEVGQDAGRTRIARASAIHGPMPSVNRPGEPMAETTAAARVAISVGWHG